MLLPLQHLISCVYNDRLLQYSDPCILPELWNIDTQQTGVPFLAEAIMSLHTTSGSNITGFFAVVGFVCVEVLRPSQPSGVMSSAVSLPNLTFTGQA